jgi:type I site-specific restriction endonuclease
MNKRADIDRVLRELETKLSDKIDAFNPDSHLEEIIKEKDLEIARLRDLPENREILDRLKEMEAIKNSMAFRFAEGVRRVLFANPLTRRILYLVRKRL